VEKVSDVFEGSNPIEIARRWLAEAETTEPNDANAMALSTVDGDGRPNSRIVLLKEIEQNGFVFYTNYNSVKSSEILASGFASFVIHWKTLRRQIRVRGRTQKVGTEQSDAYFASRSPDSRLGAIASDQSKPLLNREQLIEAVQQTRENHGDNPVRPDNWGGFRIVPFEVELWNNGAYRLHDRFRWTRTEDTGAWHSVRLYP
jgi:pyridoxamine 5'-phosphate oxidase